VGELSELAQKEALETRPGADLLARLESSPALSAWVLVALAALPLVPTLFAPFLADDYLHIKVAAELPGSLARGWVLPVPSAGAWWTPSSLTVEYFRPLVVLSFALDRLVYGLHAWGYHLTNLIVHAATTLLVWRIARHALGAGFGAWAAAALFAIHPCHAGALDWISGRTDVLAGALFAAALYAHLESRPLRAASAGRLALSGALFFGALLCKEMAVTLPAVVLLDGVLRPRGEPLARRLVAPALMGVLAVLYLVLRTTLLGGFHPPPAPFAVHPGDPGFFAHIAMAPLLYLADLVLFVLPDPMVTYPFWLAHPVALLALGALVVRMFITTVQRAPDVRTRAWALGWLAITILPVLAITVGEHFLYLPSIGYCILVGSQLPASPARVDRAMRRGLAGTAAGVLVVLLVRTVLFDSGAQTAHRAITETVEALDRFPDAKTVLVADLPATASLTFPYAVRQLRPGRDVRVETLSISEHLVTRDSGPSSASFVAPDRLELRREGGFLRSYIERALQGPPVPFRPGQIVERSTYTVTVLDAPAGTLRSFGVKLHDPGSTLVLANVGTGLGPLNFSPTLTPTQVLAK
jgi:hypothetical protein